MTQAHRQDDDDVDVLQGSEHRLSGEGALQESVNRDASGDEYLLDPPVELQRLIPLAGIEVQRLVELGERVRDGFGNFRLTGARGSCPGALLS
jgi:hypothetical protein